MQGQRGHPIPESRKREHAVFMLPVLGIVLIIPPLLILFTAPIRIFGVPLETVYLFSVWILLIIGALISTHHMPRAEIVHRDTDAKGST